MAVAHDAGASPLSSISSESEGTDEFYNNPFMDSKAPSREGVEEVPSSPSYNPFCDPSLPTRLLQDTGTERIVATARGTANTDSGKHNASPWQKAADRIESHRGRGEATGTTELLTSTVGTRDSSNSSSVEALKQQIHDLDKQMRQMQLMHEAEKGRLTSQFENRLSAMQMEYETKLNRMGEELHMKERKLSDKRKKTTQLERQVEGLQQRMQDLISKQCRHWDDSQVHEKLKMSHTQHGVADRDGPHAVEPRGVSEPGLQSPSARWSSGREEHYPWIHGSVTSAAPGSRVQPSSKGDLHVPKHLEQFSPLAKGRRMWGSRKMPG